MYEAAGRGAGALCDRSRERSVLVQPPSPSASAERDASPAFSIFTPICSFVLYFHFLSHLASKNPQQCAHRYFLVSPLVWISPPFAVHFSSSTFFAPVTCAVFSRIMFFFFIPDDVKVVLCCFPARVTCKSIGMCVKCVRMFRGVCLV